ncbi:beta-galactosidase [Clostridium butyricum]|nr:beta-galactosidase [Clostridium butyricum]
MESYEVQLKDFKKAEQELTGKERVFISQDNNTRSTTIDEIRKPLAEQLNDNTQLLNDTFPLIENYLGICSSIIDEQKVSLMNECGYSYLRIDLSWDIIEHEKGIYDFSFPDKVINLLNKYNIKPFFIFCYNNDFYSGTPGNLHTGIYTEENRNAFCNYVSAIVERYKGNNYHYEIWNEPNGAYWGSLVLMTIFYW